MSTTDFHFWLFLLVSLVSVITASCLCSITCPCGTKSNIVYTQCINNSFQEKYTCERWANCLTCEANTNYCITCPAGRSGPTCTEALYPTANCQDPGSIQNGYRRLVNGVPSRLSQIYSNGQSFQYFCNEGYEMQGTAMLTCLTSGKWSNNTPRCQRTAIDPFPYCSEPGQIPYGSYRNSDRNSATSQRYAVGASVIYFCQNGYDLVGSEMITCTSSGSWPMKPLCRKTATNLKPLNSADPSANCPDPGSIQNGYRRFMNGLPVKISQVYSNGQTFQYFCNEGYELQGQNVLSCLTSGKWTSNKPWCQNSATGLPESYCLFPEVNTTGMIITPRGLKFPPGTEMKFDCKEGYTLEGNDFIIYCNLNGEWTSKPPICRQKSPPEATPPLVTPIVCPNPTFDPNGEMEDIFSIDPRRRTQGFEAGSQVRFTCKRGYEVNGPNLITCLRTGQWSSDSPTCTSTSGDKATPPVVTPMACPKPIVDPNGEMEEIFSIDPRRRTQVFEAGSQVSFTCRSGYEINGPYMITCLRSGQWSSESPTCTRTSGDKVVCADPGSIQKGGVTVHYNKPNVRPYPSSERDNTYSYPEGTELIFDCINGYLLEGERKLNCMSTGRWSGDKPRCTKGVPRSDCGRSKLSPGSKITHGRSAQEGEFPWIVFISINESPTLTRTFTGILLDHSTVLTVAHYLTNVEFCTLYFGKLKRNNLNDDRFVEARLSSEIIIHPEYNSKTYDNDIAIVKFSPDISYSTNVEPICAPTPDSSERNIEPGQTGYVIGWGLNKDNLPSPNLMVAPLPIKATQTCVRDFQRQDEHLKITSGMFCAGFTNSQNLVDTCYRGSGAALVFYNSEIDRFTLEGISSHRAPERCYSPENSIIFTRVSYYVQWILQYLKN